MHMHTKWGNKKRQETRKECPVPSAFVFQAEYMAVLNLARSVKLAKSSRVAIVVKTLHYLLLLPFIWSREVPLFQFPVYSWITKSGQFTKNGSPFHGATCVFQSARCFGDFLVDYIIHISLHNHLQDLDASDQGSKLK